MTMDIGPLEVDGETERQFEWLLDNMETGGGEPPGPEELAERLLAERVLELYVQAQRSNFQ